MMERQLKLKKIILSNQRVLQSVINVPWADPVLLIASIAEVESKFGFYNVPNYEKAFDLGGPYAKDGLWFRWGSWAACSYSSFQIMYPVAVELGFNGERSPLELWDDDVAFHFVLEYIKKRILGKGASSIDEFADAYNSGSFKDKNIPQEYIRDFKLAYENVNSKYQLLPVREGEYV